MFYSESGFYSAFRNIDSWMIENIYSELKVGNLLQFCKMILSDDISKD